MQPIELNNPDLQHAAQSGGPVEVIVGGSGQSYFLVPAEQYRNLQAAVTGDFDPRETYPLIEKLMAEDDANDPWLDSYQ
jgi:hypothetical protein